MARAADAPNCMVDSTRDEPAAALVPALMAPELAAEVTALRAAVPAAARTPMDSAALPTRPAMRGSMDQPALPVDPPERKLSCSPNAERT